jgi:hypothetical protein
MSVTGMPEIPIGGSGAAAVRLASMRARTGPAKLLFGGAGLDVLNTAPSGCLAMSPAPFGAGADPLMQYQRTA